MPNLPLTPRNLFVFFGLTLLIYATPFWFYDRTPGRDWEYFNSLSWMVRTTILHFKQLPLHDPWVCGGVDILANPQSRLFSPMLLFDVFLLPPHANIASQAVYTFLGFIGWAMMIRNFAVSPIAAWLSGFCFLFASYFTLHASEGHIPFGSMQLFPLVVALLFKLSRPFCLVCFFLLLSVMILDGGIYAAIYSILLAATSLLMFPKIRAQVRTICVSPKLRTLAMFSSIAAFVLSLAKIIPVLTHHGGRNPTLDFFNMDLSTVLYAFFYPRQTISAEVQQMNGPGFRELGCYLGLGALFTIFWASWNSDFRRRNLALYGGILFWFWVGSGWGGLFNPWHLFHFLPFFNHAHIQSRVFILMFFFYCLLLAYAGDQVRSLQNRRVFFALITLIVVEGALMRNIGFHRVFTRSFESTEDYRQPIDSQKLSQTVQSDKDFGGKHQHYMKGNIGSKTCYEPTISSTPVLAFSDPAYRGEIFSDQKDVQPSLDRVSPGNIVFTYVATDKPALIHINLTTLDHWDVQEGDAKVISGPQELLGIEVPASESTLAPKRIVLTYSPLYLTPVFTCFGIGILAFCLLLLLAKRWSLDSQPQTNVK